MSSKQSTSKDSRIAKKEVMVTRHKSAQMKRQLRVKDRSMKHVTDLLKSPTKDTQANHATNMPKDNQKPKTPPKLKQSLLKSVERVQKLPEKVFKLSKMLRKKVALVEDVEFYPNKRKRTLDVKKVVLKPNHELQMVGSIVGSVKRKCGVPHKASSKIAAPEATSPEHSPLTMAEVISIMEEDLTDEDLMEILTCPSPVWWEDGPGEEYIEEAVFRRTPEPPPKLKKQEAGVSMEVTAEEVKKKDINILNLNKKGEKFLKKRSKLEGLLGNIKNKSDTKISSVNSNKDKAVSCSNNVFNEDLVVICSNYRNNKTSDNKHESNKERQRMKSQSDSDDIIFHDSSMNEDELLKSLENIEIPIANTKVNSKTDVIVIDDDDDDVLEITGDICMDKSKDKEIEENSVKDERKKLNEKLDVPKYMPVLVKFENKGASPKSFDSCSSKISASSHDLDSISDTNVKFILDEEVDEIKMTNNLNSNEKAVVIKKEDINNIKPESSKESSSKNTTTYRIADETSDTKLQIKNVDAAKETGSQDDKSTKINDYYKKCKKLYQKKDKTDINKNEVNLNTVQDENDATKFIFCESCLPKTKKVSGEKNMKYCLKCSSIFDTDDCFYCLEKSKGNVFSCLPCKSKFCCQVLFKAHCAQNHMAHNS